MKTLIFALVGLCSLAVATPAEARDKHRHRSDRHYSYDRHDRHHHHHPRVIYRTYPRYYAPTRYYYTNDYYTPRYYRRPGWSLSFGF